MLAVRRAGVGELIHISPRIGLGDTLFGDDDDGLRMGDVLFLRWLAAVVLLVAWAALARAQVRRAQCVWRSEKVTFLPITANGPEINRRNYPTFTAFVVLLCGVGVLVFLGELLVGEPGLKRDTIFQFVVAFMGLLAFSLFPVLSVITAFNRPRCLVPPPLRGDAGSWARARKRRERRRRALPETEHEVEILDVRPASDDPKPFSPYLVAVCASEDCAWMSDVVDSADDTDAERAVRELAASHSSNVVGPRRPVG